MTGKEFLKQLEKLLKDLPEHDREDALAYYKDYLEEAGPENEAAVIKELGSPEKVAETIKRDVKANDQAEYTERGYSDGSEPVNSNTPSVKEQKKDGKKEKTGKSFPWALIIVLAVFASPLLIGAAGALFGVVVAVLATIFGLGVALLALVVAGLVGGLALIVFGIVKLVGNVGLGLLGIGVGILLFAAGLLLLMLAIWLIAKVIPAVFRLVVDLLQKLWFRIRGGNRNE